LAIHDALNHQYLLLPNHLERLDSVATAIAVCCNAGRILHHQLKKCLLAPDKLAAECRAKGHLSMQEVYVIVLEPSGTFSVISRGG
jgi:uncharacterized membrane protein YcaP (DUF421 family)